jgi:hypothetical protein
LTEVELNIEPEERFDFEWGNHGNFSLQARHLRPFNAIQN